MAYSFDGATNYFWKKTSDDYTIPISLSAWVYVIGNTAGTMPFVISRTTGSRAFIGLNIGSSNRWFMSSSREATGAGIQAASATNALLVNKWQFVGGRITGPCNSFSPLECVMTNATICCTATAESAYNAKDILIVNSVLTGATVTDYHTALSIGARRRGDGVVESRFSGYVAEAAAWNIDLTNDEFRSLGRGIKPTSIRPQNLISYFPGIRNSIDVVEGINFTSVNSPSPIDDHSRRYG